MELIRGRITNYQSVRNSANFVFTESDQATFGVIAIPAGLVGAAAQSAGMLHSATSVEEEADYVSFDLVESKVRGWVWRSPFSEGDEVEVVAKRQNEHFEAYGIVRPLDRMVALYPHCSRALVPHIQNALKWIFYITVFTMIFLEVVVFFVGLGMHDLKYAFSAVTDSLVLLIPFFIFYGVMVGLLTKKWLPFVRLTERIFRCLEWQNYKNIDLVKSSKRKRAGNEPRGYGTFFFRY